MNEVSTPPWRIKSSIKWPTSLSAKAVQTAVRKPKQRRRPRATLYSPPPSQALNSRAVRTRLSPGSRRSMISPRAIRSNWQEPAGLIFSIGIVQLPLHRTQALASRRNWGDPSSRGARASWRQLLECADLSALSARVTCHPAKAHLSRLVTVCHGFVTGLSRVKSHKDPDSIDLSPCHGSRRGVSPLPPHDPLAESYCLPTSGQFTTFHHALR